MRGSPGVHGTVFSGFFSLMSLLRGEYTHSLLYLMTAIAWMKATPRSQERTASLFLRMWFLVGVGVSGVAWAAIVAKHRLVGLFADGSSSPEVFWYVVWYLIVGVGQPLTSLLLYPLPAVLGSLGNEAVRIDEKLYLILFYTFIIFYSVSILLIYWIIMGFE